MEKGENEIIRCLAELDDRGYYRDLGYSSLFTYCTEALGYSEGSACRRIQAARSLKSNPEVFESVKTGKLSITAVAEIAKVKEESAKTELFKASEGKSTREVQAMTLCHLPPQKPKRETIRAKTVVSDPKEADLFTDAPAEKEATKKSYSITIEVDEEFMQLLEEARALSSHRPTSELFRKTLKEYVDRRTVSKRAPKAVSVVKNKRFIPKSVKVAVRKRDNCQCAYVSPDGRRCREKVGLEFDHIIPTASAGGSDINNLRLVCRAHNQLYAERFFGREFMKGKVLARKRVRSL